MIKRLGLCTVAGLSLALVLLGVYYLKVKNWGKTPVQLPAAVQIDFPRGTRLQSLASQLESVGVISSAEEYKAWIRMFGNYSRYQAGRYQFEGLITPAQVDDTISKGKTLVTFALQVVIPEGFSLNQVISRLEARGVGDEKTLRKLVRDQSFMRAQNIVAKSLEGYLFPATYNFVKIPSPSQALSKMIATFWENLPKNYLERIRKKQLSLTEAITFASLIEMETTHSDEMNMISEVIWNRLGSNEPLGIDAALIYGIKNYQGDIKWKHLRDRSNKYNTRIHRGLPPGPIGAVSTAALEAVLNPTTAGYYFYVLKAGTTRHHFSKTLDEHNKYVELLIKKQE